MLLESPPVNFLTSKHWERCSLKVNRVLGDYYGLQFCAGGGLYLGNDPDTCFYKKSVAWITQPGRKYTYYAEPEKGWWDHHFICFIGPRTDEWKKNGLLDEAPVKPRFEKTFQKKALSLLSRINRRDKFEQLRCIHLLEELLIELAESRIPQDEDSMGEAVIANQDYRAVAEQYGMSFSKFLRTFKDLYQTTPHQYYMSHRIEQVPEYLEHDYTLEDIAEALGFSDEFHLAKQFKHYFQLTPGQFKKSLLKD